MDDKKNIKEETYIDILKVAQNKMNGIILPSMGLLDNEVKIEINGSEFLNKKKDGEEKKVC